MTAARNLVHFTFHGCLTRGAPLTLAEQPKTLPLLKTVNISSISKRSLTSILSYIDAPNCDYMHLSANQSHHRHSRLYDHFTRQIKPPSSILTPNPARVRLWEEDLFLDGRLFHLSDDSDSSPCFGMQFILEAIPGHAFQSVPVHVSIEENFRSIAPEYFLTALDAAFPHLVELSLPPTGFLHWDLLGKLYRPEAGTPPRFLLPNLKQVNLCGEAPLTKRLRRAVRIASSRMVEHIVDGHLVPPAPFDAIHVPPDTPIHTPCYRKILRDAQGIVPIIGDARSQLPRVPQRRRFFDLISRRDPMYPPDDGMSWVEEIIEPEVEVVESRGYDVSTSDEEEPDVQGSSEEGSEEKDGET